MTNTTNNTPDITKTAFSCPHCGAYTTQHWKKIYILDYSEVRRTPIFPEIGIISDIRENTEITQKEKEKFIIFVQNINKKHPFIEHNSDYTHTEKELINLNTSQCYNCNEFSIWVHDQLIWPETKFQIEPNDDLSPEIKTLFNEARAIVTSSPRGAAALLRLCVQHLCKDLGEAGRNIDQDIANLVTKGLNPIIQQALDIVRVIGNESVHPGEIDLNDNREISLKLFDLINLIADQMITQPKNVQDLFQSLPKNKIEGIEQRNKRATQQKKRII